MDHSDGKLAEDRAWPRQDQITRVLNGGDWHILCTTRNMNMVDSLTYRRFYNLQDHLLKRVSP